MNFALTRRGAGRLALAAAFWRFPGTVRATEGEI